MLHHGALCGVYVLKTELTFRQSKTANYSKKPSAAFRSHSPTPMDLSGLDSDGRKFSSAEEMWNDQVGDATKKTDWYRQGVGYWEVSTNFFGFYFFLFFIIFSERKVFDYFILFYFVLFCFVFFFFVVLFWC